jgi:protein subunit release factor A
VTDHRINVSWYNLEAIIDGDLDDVLTQTRAQLGSLPQASSMTDPSASL